MLTSSRGLILQIVPVEALDISIGTPLVTSISKLANLILKIFTKSEIAYCKKFDDPYPHFAGRFALKEAVQKSIHKNLIFKNIETYHSNSKPKIYF